jgi:putative tryptophan/tyrosine transport system substrate-binding protein
VHSILYAILNLEDCRVKRREFIVGLGSAVVWPLAARAQQGAGMPVIGIVHAEPMELLSLSMLGFSKGLAEVGFVEGRNVAIGHRWDEGHAERRGALVADLIRRQVSVIFVDTTGLARMAKEATRTIPIVFLAGGNPVEFGVVASLNRPGGNVTGVALLNTEIMGKRLELLHKLVPGTGPIGFFARPAGQYTEAETRDLPSAARTLGIKVTVFNIADAGDLQRGFAKLVEQKARALLLSANIVFEAQVRDQIILLATRDRVPTMFNSSASAVAGALASYGPDFLGAYQQAGNYAGRILKGDKPADLPVLQPTKLELVFNLKTAKALGLTIPPSLLALADEVIE